MDELNGELFRRLQDICPQIIPTMAREKTIVEVCVSQQGTVEDLQLYGDLEFAETEGFKRTVFDLLAGCSQLPADNSWQIHVYQQGITSAFVSERCLEGLILEIGFDYVIVKAGETRVHAYSKDRDLRISSQCKLVRNGAFFEIQPIEYLSMVTLSNFNIHECPVFNEAVDIATIDVNQYPKTCGDQRLPILSLGKVFKYSPVQRTLVDRLQEKYTHWRRIRGDGDCYYRSVAVSYMEYLCRRNTDAREIMTFAEGLKMQSNVFVIHEFAPQFKHFSKEVSALAEFKAAGGDAISQLQQRFKDSRYDQSAAASFRCIAWFSFNHLLNNSPDFSNFLDNPAEHYFNMIRTKGKEAEGLVFRAMAQALGAKIVHVTLDTLQCREDIYEAVGVGEKAVLSLLFKPGHYDVLYSIASQAIDQYIYSTNSFQTPPVPLPLALATL